MLTMADSISRSLYFQKAMGPYESFASMEAAKQRLKEVTWGDLVRAFMSRAYPEFTPRLGAFLKRPAIAVFWKGEIVALRFIKEKEGKELKIFSERPITDGWTLLPSDFENKIANIKITDKVITDDE